MTDKRTAETDLLDAVDKHEAARDIGFTAGYREAWASSIMHSIGMLNAYVRPSENELKKALETAYLALSRIRDGHPDEKG